MHCKRLPSVFLLLTMWLCPANAVFAAPDLAIGDGNPVDQAGGGDVAGEAGQDQVFTYFFPLILASVSSCDHTIELDTVVADGRRNYSSVRPGETVCIAAGRRADLLLRNFQGTPGNPIVFTNSGGQVVIDSNISHGILVQNSRFFRLTGGGAYGVDYGIRIVRSAGVGVNVGYKSSDFEIDHVRVDSAGGAGISAKTVAVCSDGSTNDYDYDGDGVVQGDPDDVVNRGNFTQFNFDLHDNYIRNVGIAFYVGSSFYLGRDLNCGRGPETVYDPVIRGVRLYGNTVTDVATDGIQVGSATERCAVHHNRVLRDSQANMRFQQSGIMNNPGSVCNIYNNFIKDGGGPGIFVQGNGGNVIYNNVIVNAGQNKPLGGDCGDGIAIFGGSNPGNSIYVFNNTIVRPVGFGVHFVNPRGSDNRIQNNIIIDPGYYESYGSSAYVQTGMLTNVIVTNNFTSQILTDARFTNPTADDFSIRSDSPAVDSGVEPDPGMVTIDYADTVRPQGPHYDIGAYECEFPPRP